MIGFQWILDNQLAGSSKPGLYGEYKDDLTFIQDNGFTVIVSLTEEPFELENGENIKLMHFPIPDMGVPQPRNAYNFVLGLKSLLDEGEKVLVHCKAGLGRTGTILSCILVLKGYAPEEAIKYVRKKNGSYIQNGLQENFVNHFEAYANQQSVNNS